MSSLPLQTILKALTAVYATVHHKDVTSRYYTEHQTWGSGAPSASSPSPRSLRPVRYSYNHFKILTQVTSVHFPCPKNTFTQTSSENACRTFGLRSRPEICGSDTCGGSFPSAVQGTGVIWLEGVACTGVEWRIHDCPAGMRNRVDVITGTYGFTKWGGAQEDMPRDPDVGVCCWFSPRPPILPSSLLSISSTPPHPHSIKY